MSDAGDDQRRCAVYYGGVGGVDLVGLETAGPSAYSRPEVNRYWHGSRMLREKGWHGVGDYWWRPGGTGPMTFDAALGISGLGQKVTLLQAMEALAGMRQPMIAFTRDFKRAARNTLPAAARLGAVIAEAYSDG